MTDVIKKIAARFSGDSRRRIIIAVGCAAILLIFLSDTLASCGNRKKDTAAQPDQMTAQEYTDQLERRLCDILSSIDGAGEVKVMVTLQNGMEYVYASEEKSSVDTSESKGSSGQESSDAKESTQREFILIDTEDGEEALVRTQLMPTINGVLVVCDGANDPVVRELIESAVTTALNISAKRVCIIPIADSGDR